MDLHCLHWHLRWSAGLKGFRFMKSLKKWSHLLTFQRLYSIPELKRLTAEHCSYCTLMSTFHRNLKKMTQAKKYLNLHVRKCTFGCVRPVKIQIIRAV